MKTLRFLVVLLGIVILSACADSAEEIKAGKQTLVAFFKDLNGGNYTAADALYGGSYDVLIDNNPNVNPDDHVTLWEHDCKINGLQCLTVRSATFEMKTGEEFAFAVEFNNPDGSLFVRGPCCGATETEMPSQSTFEFHVFKIGEGLFKVRDMPVYVP